MRRLNISSKAEQQGVVLVEAMVAILLFSVGVLAVAGLQGSMIKNTTDSKYRIEAGYIAQQKLGEFWSDTNLQNLASHFDNNKDISALLPNGTLTAAQSGVTSAQSGVEIVITIQWQQPGQDKHQYSTTALIAGS